LLFDLMPKARREDLFDFDEELGRLTRLLGDSRTRLIVVKGLRRTGKTSLILTALNSIGSPYALIDVREVVRSRRGLYMALERAINDLLRLRSPLTAELRRALEAVRGVRVAGLEVSLSWGRDRPTLTAPRPLGQGFCAHWGLPITFQAPPRARHHRSGPAVSPGEARAHGLLSSPAPNSTVKL